MKLHTLTQAIIYALIESHARIPVDLQNVEFYSFTLTKDMAP